MCEWLYSRVAICTTVALHLSAPLFSRAPIKSEPWAPVPHSLPPPPVQHPHDPSRPFTKPNAPHPSHLDRPSASSPMRRPASSPRRGRGLLEQCVHAGRQGPAGCAVLAVQSERRHLRVAVHAQPGRPGLQQKALSALMPV